MDGKPLTSGTQALALSPGAIVLAPFTFTAPPVTAPSRARLDLVLYDEAGNRLDDSWCKDSFDLEFYPIPAPHPPAPRGGGSWFGPKSPPRARFLTEGAEPCFRERRYSFSHTPLETTTGIYDMSDQQKKPIKIKIRHKQSPEMRAVRRSGKPSSAFPLGFLVFIMLLISGALIFMYMRASATHSPSLTPGAIPWPGCG